MVFEISQITFKINLQSIHFKYSQMNGLGLGFVFVAIFTSREEAVHIMYIRYIKKKKKIGKKRKEANRTWQLK